LALADEHQVPILEDDYDSELRYAGPALPALKSGDTAGQVVYAGTFSKVLFPSLRLGYVVADRPLLARLAPGERLRERGGRAGGARHAPRDARLRPARTPYASPLRRPARRPPGRAPAGHAGRHALDGAPEWTSGLGHAAAGNRSRAPRARGTRSRRRVHARRDVPRRWQGRRLAGAVLRPARSPRHRRGGRATPRRP